MSKRKEVEERKRAKRKAALGEPYSRAYHRLIRKIVRQYFETVTDMVCHRCKKLIEVDQQFHIDHMIDWLESPDPVSYFFDLTNLAPSHATCNSKHGGHRGSARQQIHKARKMLFAND